MGLSSEIKDLSAQAVRLERCGETIKSAKIWQKIGELQVHQLNDLSAALDALSRSLSLNPADAQTYFLMGYVSQKLNSYEDSIELFKIGLEFAPDHAEILSYLGVAYLNRREFALAQDFILKALDKAPDNPNVFLNALWMGEILPLSPDEERKLMVVVSRNKYLPGFVESVALFEAKECVKSGQYDDARQSLMRVADDADRQGAAKYYMLAGISRKEGDVDKAFELYGKANQMQSKSKAAKVFKRETLDSLIDKSLEILTPDFAAATDKNRKSISAVAEKENYPDPVFLIGFPRSGTTLMGKILGSHSSLFTGDEYGAIDEIISHMRQKFGLSFPEDLKKITAEHVLFMRELYNQKQGGLPLRHGDKVFIDKMPFNLVHIPLICTIFPKAKFLCMVRHPLDAVLSSYMQFFALNPGTIHLLDIGASAHLYRKLHLLWGREKDVLLLNTLEVNYESLVNNFEVEVKRILDFIGVEWDEKVRKFYQEDTDSAFPSTLTPSRTQVSQDLYKEPQGRWKKYEKHLEEAKSILHLTVAELGYSDV